MGKNRIELLSTGFLLLNLHKSSFENRLWGAGGAEGVRIFFFFKHGHVAYQIDGDDKQNRMQVKFSSKGQTGDLGLGQKVKYH